MTSLETIRARLASMEFAELLGAMDGISDRPTRIGLYREWIALHTGRSMLLYAAWFNLGVELSAARDIDNAIIAQRNALALRPDLYQASVNLGLLEEGKGNSEEALRVWKGARQPDEARTTLLNHEGRLLESMKRFQEAEAALWASLLTTPNQPDAIQHWVMIRQTMCAWPVLGNGLPGMSMAELELHVGPLGSLALYDDVGMLSRINARWLDRKIPPAPHRLSPEQGYRHDRIRVGYLSSDFCRHAMSFLIAELFERHDRSKFEVYGFCTTVDDGSEVRKRVIAAFDHFVPIRDMTDEQAAQAIRAHEIDILIDLNGLTAGARPKVFRWRPAPVQATYLGYIGPVPIPELDYIICDRHVIPEDIAPAYAPRPLYLKSLFQANDSKAVIGKPTTRAAAGLPEDRFVYSCFANHYKITEPVFAAWMEILRQTGDSVLWLIRDNEWSCANLHARAREAGIDPERIIFADRVSPEDYMVRFTLPDLFLDTTPYNSGTVASDALRMGLPIVTLSGRSFSSRMAGSLLHAIGLPETVTDTVPDYVRTAVTLAKDRDLLDRYRSRIGGEAWRRSVGNIERFTTELEDALQSVVKRP